MTDLQQEGGVYWEFSEAEKLFLGTTPGTPEWSLAQRRYSEAIRNFMIASTVPTLKVVLESVLNERLSPIVEAVGNQTKVQDQRFGYTLSQLDAFLSKEDHRHDVQGTEFDGLRADFQQLHKELRAGQDSLQASFHSVQVDLAEYGESLSEITVQLGEFQSRLEEMGARMTRVEDGALRRFGLLDEVKLELQTLRSDYRELYQKYEAAIKEISEIREKMIADEISPEERRRLTEMNRWLSLNIQRIILRDDLELDRE